MFKVDANEVTNKVCGGGK